jgi:hypothetical protein
LGSLSNDLPGSSANDRPQHLARDRAELKFLRLGCLQGSMPEHDVTQFVRHHARDLIVGPGRLQHASIEEHRTTRQCEGIDPTLVDYIERISERGLPEARRDRSDQPRANPLDQVLSRSIVQHRKLLSHLRSRLSSELNILPRREAVSTRLDARLGRKRRADEKRRDREQNSMMA